MATAALIAPKPTPAPRTLTLPQRQFLSVWTARAGASGYATFADIFEPEIDALDAHEFARMLGIYHRLVNRGWLVPDTTRRPEHLRKYRPAALVA